MNRRPEPARRAPGATPPGQPARPSPGAGSRLPRAFQVGAFRWYWSSQLVSGIGTWAQAVAQSWLVLELTHSAVMLGTVTMLQFLPMLIFPLLGGVIADRLPRRRMLIATQSAAMLQALLLGTLVATHTVQLWEVAALALMLGLTNAFNNPAAQAFVPELVGGDLVADAVAINSIQFNLARMVGGAVGGVAVAWWGIPGALFLNTASYLPAVLVLARIRPLHVTVRQARGDTHVVREVTEGLRYALTTPPVRRVVLLFGVVGLLGFNWQVALPLLAVTLHGGVTGFGTLMSALGAGSLVAGAVLARNRRPSERRLALGGLGLGAALVLLGASPWYGASLVLMVVAGFVGVLASVTANTLLQIRTPDTLRGRVMSIYVLLMGGTTPVGAFLLGTIAGGWGIRVGLLAFGALAIVAIGGIQLRGGPVPIDARPLGDAGGQPPAGTDALAPVAAASAVTPAARAGGSD
ncbi:MAG: MFS transporter [Candidatus Limnocylindrales bacterium]